MREVIEDVLNGRGLDDKTYLVSKTWFASIHCFPVQFCGKDLQVD